MFCYRQCLTVDAGASVNADEGESNSCFKTPIEGEVPEGPTIEPKSVKVSSTCLLICCHLNYMLKEEVTVL